MRLFAPGETTEETVRFRPDGAPLGFTLRLPETFVPADRAGLALDRAAAQALAERAAHDDWGVDFGAYRLLEATDQTRTTGRVDHAFVYERTAGHLGDARFRLRVAVAGNVLVEVAPFAFIPESFDRRFSEMRSANNAIAGAAGVVAVLLYGIGGCVIGVLWLARRHWLLWRPALVAGFALGALLGAASLADIPGAWFGFDTAQSVTSFWLREAGKAAAAMLGGGLVLGLVFMAAESLSRRAFAAHPQLWRVWSREAAPTTAVLGRTLGGYLFVPIELAFIAVFYCSDQSLARLVAALRGADRSRDSRQRRAGARCRSRCRCRPASWRSACSAQCRSRSPHSSDNGSVTGRRRSRSRSSCRRSCSRAVTRAIPAFRRTRDSSSCSCRRSCGR